MKQKKLITIIALSIIVLIIGCAKDDFVETIGLCPIVVSTNPTDGATNVPLNQVITVTFNEEMNPSTINQDSFTIVGTSAIGGVISYSGATYTFTPTSPLTPNTTYVGTITTAAHDPNGNALQQNYAWSFSTGALLQPMVLTTSPNPDETGVALNKVITATFNMPMDPATMNETTFLVRQGNTPILGVITYSENTASFTPNVNLTAGTVYTATITTGAKNLADTPIAANYVWNFTTGTLIAPNVISTSPVNNETGVLLNKIITATFDMPMDPTTINQTTFLLKQGITPIVGTVTYSGNTASFTPSVNLTAGLVYTATITIGAKNLAGTPITANYIWSFTTASATVVAPIVISTDPTNGATGVLLNKTITATFNMAMNPLTITNISFTLKRGNTPVVGNVTYAGNTASFDPTTDLLANTTYTATITTIATNVAGVPLANNYEWTFTTLNNFVGPNLGTISLFGAYGGTAGVTNQGLNTVINGGLGTTAVSTAVTGFHDATAIYTETPLNVGNVTGGIFTAPPPPGTASSFAIATQALADANALYISISPASMPGGIDPGAGQLGGLTLAPGVYKSAAGPFNITNGNLTLDAQGNPNAIWIFQAPSSLTVGIAGPTGAKSVILTNGALAKNVFWYVGSAATINGAGGGVMVGNIISSAGVTFSTAGNATQTVLNGRAISLIGSVTMVNTTINVPN